MTQEEKQLLLVDLLPRILHGVKVHHYQGSDCVLKSIDLRTYAAYVEVYEFMSLKDFIQDGQRSIFEYKPYLRQLNSMTEEEKNELFQLMGNGTDIQRVDFYNAHHFDYRGLIPMGLTLEAPEGMYNAKTE